MNFPADKQEVASNAESNDAPQAVIAKIRNSSTECFEGLEEVLQAVRERPNDYQGDDYRQRCEYPRRA
jgi:hypothetical protein